MKHSPLPSDFVNGQYKPSCCRKKTVNEEDMREPFAREQRKVNGGP